MQGNGRLVTFPKQLYNHKALIRNIQFGNNIGLPNIVTYVSQSIQAKLSIYIKKVSVITLCSSFIKWRQ